MNEVGRGFAQMNAERKGSRELREHESLQGFAFANC
jgi:hypothetical protein